MNRRTRSILCYLVLIIIVGLPVLLTWRAVRQERLDRALIAAVVKDDAPAVVSLLAQGADANARDLPPDTRSFWRQMLDRLRGRDNQQPSAQSALFLASDWSPRFDKTGICSALYSTLARSFLLL